MKKKAKKLASKCTVKEAHILDEDNNNITNQFQLDVLS